MTIHTMRWATFAVWALVAASAALWGLRLFAAGPALPPHASAVSGAMSLRGDPQRLLGGAPAAAAAPAPVALPTSSRFALVGVLAPKSTAAAAEGVALIAVDGQPPRAYRVGAAVDGELVVQKVHARGVELGARGAPPSVALDTPPLPPPAAGSAPRPLPVQPFARGLPRPLPVPLPEPVTDMGTAVGEPDAGDDGMVDEGDHQPTMPPGVARR